MSKRNRNPDANNTEERIKKRQRIEDCLKCSVCWNWNTQPIILSCGHTLCQSCFCHESMNRDKCPLCRAKIDSLQTSCYPLRNLAIMFAEDDEENDDEMKRKTEDSKHVSPRHQAAGFTFSSPPTSMNENLVVNSCLFSSIVESAQDQWAKVLATKAAHIIPMSLWNQGIYIWFPASSNNFRFMVERFAFYMQTTYRMDVYVHKTYLLCSIKSRSNHCCWQTTTKPAPSSSGLKESIAVLVHPDASFSTHEVDAPFVTDENRLSEFEISRFVHKKPLGTV